MILSAASAVSAPQERTAESAASPDVFPNDRERAAKGAAQRINVDRPGGGRAHFTVARHLWRLALVPSAMLAARHSLPSPSASPPPPFSGTAPSASTLHVEVRERVLASVVGIRATLDVPQIKFSGKRKVVAEVSPSEGTGSGIVVEASGVILTCAHVVGASGKVRVFLSDDREVAGIVQVVDRASDLALVKVDAGPLPTLDLRSPPALGKGEPVYLASRPGGAAIRLVEGTLAVPGAFHVGHSQLEFFRQFEGGIEPGDSGGALIDEKGSLLGVVSVGVPDTRIGYAIAREFLVVALHRLRAGPPVVWPWLGLAVETPLDGRGALVWSVLPGSPAAGAGLRSGDRIMSINGRPVEHFLTAMLTVIAHPIGSRFKLGFERSSGETRATMSSPESASEPGSDGVRPVSGAQEGGAKGTARKQETVECLSAPRAIDPLFAPLDLFEKQTGIRLEQAPASEGHPESLRVVHMPSVKGASAPYAIGSRLVGIVAGPALVRALEEGRTDQQMDTGTKEELGEALRASYAGDRIAAALVWETAGRKATMFVSGEARRYPIL